MIFVSLHIRTVLVPFASAALLVAALAAGSPVSAAAQASPPTPHPVTAAASPSAASKPDCRGGVLLCTEVSDPETVFGQGTYVGHDEPSLLFNSTQPGSGNRMTYQGIIPRDPSARSGSTFTFQNYVAFWFGMAMCDTQSYPETVKTCLPDSDANITRPGAPYHAGTAYMELQFYPPGFVRQFNGGSCSATQWCAALNIDSLSLNPLTGRQLNPACQARILGGLEYINFAYLTRDGAPQGPPNPVQFDPVASGQPNLNKVVTLNPGDHYRVTLHDTAHGLRTDLIDTTTGESGSMTASAANGFGQVKYAPTPATDCTLVPYDFHPMYSTSGPKTTVPWAAATYNVAIDTEVGHFDYCNRATSFGGGCAATEGAGTNIEPTDVDDVGCFNAAASTLVRVSGCYGTNTGFDGTTYLPDWPDGTRARPTPTVFTSPRTGPTFADQYQQVAFNTDLPRVEFSTCNRTTGSGCTLIPTTDDGTPAAFYPYYTSGPGLGGCAWTIGQDVPGFSTHNYGRNAQYGSLLKVVYTTPGGGTVGLLNDFQNVLSTNPCPQG